MIVRKIYILVVLLAVMGGRANITLAEEVGFVVIAHPSVPVDQLSKKDLKRVYTKELTSWSDGTQIYPIENSGAAKAKFIREIIGQNENENKSYWINQTMTTGKRPPKSFGMPVLILNYVTKTPGAIGYIKAGSNLNTFVKLVTIE